jgi:hypothetical protein
VPILQSVQWHLWKASQIGKFALSGRELYRLHPSCNFCKKNKNLHALAESLSAWQDEIAENS